MFYFHGTREPDFKSMTTLDYDQYWKFLRGQDPKVRKHLRAREIIFIDWIKEGSKVLDIACGTSSFLRELKKKKHCEVEGTDISAVAVEKQNEIGIPSFVSDISSKDFKLGKKYDYIVLSEIIEHLVYPEQLLSNIKHSADYLIISLPNSAFYKYRLGLLLKGRFFTQWAFHPSEHLRFWSHTDMLEWLEALGFDVVRWESSNGLDLGPLKLYRWLPNLFGHQICYMVKAKD